MTAEDKHGETVNRIKEFAKTEGSDVVVICADIEAEISLLEPDEREMFLEELGINESGLDKLIKASYRLLDLISFLTAGEPEVRAWTIKKGSKAPQAAGKRGYVPSHFLHGRPRNVILRRIGEDEQVSA